MNKRLSSPSAPLSQRIGSLRANPTDQLAAILDHCTQAKALAEAIGDRFLAYMLAMTIQEASGQMEQANPPVALHSGRLAPRMAGKSSSGPDDRN